METIVTGLDFVQKINELDERLIILDPHIDSEGKTILRILLPSKVPYSSHGDYDYVYRKLVSLYEKGTFN